MNSEPEAEVILSATSFSHPLPTDYIAHCDRTVRLIPQFNQETRIQKLEAL
ncbi:MAG: hypothetical protein ICV63_03665 [Coleofasciculus sp. Co-bin14]|nr:hypothetical protein [Coleofasciculus sp. Co-bin14]MBD0386052.1 hypothetical protein [Nostoc sp. C3-bin3]